MQPRRQTRSLKWPCWAASAVPKACASAVDQPRPNNAQTLTKAQCGTASVLAHTVLRNAAGRQVRVNCSRLGRCRVCTRAPKPPTVTASLSKCRTGSAPLGLHCVLHLCCTAQCTPGRPACEQHVCRASAPVSLPGVPPAAAPRGHRSRCCSAAPASCITDKAGIRIHCIALLLLVHNPAECVKGFELQVPAC
jgi:hypothetical protein